MTTAAERADLDVLAELDARPTAGQRVTRTAAQTSVAYVVLDAAKAFDWIGAEHWTPDQARAAQALGLAVVAAIQNLGPRALVAVGRWWKARRGAE